MNRLQIWTAANGEGFWIVALPTPPALYLVLAAVDTLRKYALEKPLPKWMEPMLDRIDGWLTTKEEA